MYVYDTVNTTTVVVLFCNFVYDILNCYKMWVITTGTSSVLKKKKTGKESQYMVSRPEFGSDPPIGSDRELGCDTCPHGTNLSARVFSSN